MSENKYIDASAKQFKYYKYLVDSTLEQLSDEECLHIPAEESNSVAIIINHLTGNLLSRWTNFLEEDGEKPWRQRDREFEDVLHNKAEIKERWEAGWKVLTDTLNSLTDNDLERIIYIRNEGHTVLEAIHRQLGHFSYHIGQIVFLGKMIKGKSWKSLSIPKGKSDTFNEEKFKKEKQKKHFTDEIKL